MVHWAFTSWGEWAGITRLSHDWAFFYFLFFFLLAFYLRSSVEIEHNSLLLGNDAPDFLPGFVSLAVLQEAAYDAAAHELSCLDLKGHGKRINTTTSVRVPFQRAVSRACSSPPGCPSSCLQPNPLPSGWRNSLCRLCWSCCRRIPEQPCCLNTSSRPPVRKTERSLSPWSIFTATVALFWVDWWL